MRKIYTYKAVDKFLNDLSEKGYECIQLDEGCLGSGDWCCIAPDEHHYNVIIKEIYINAWTSGHTIRRCKKLSKAMLYKLQEMGMA